jgi:hypothetical protein
MEIVKSFFKFALLGHKCREYNRWGGPVRKKLIEFYEKIFINVRVLKFVSLPH